MAKAVKRPRRLRKWARIALECTAIIVGAVALVSLYFGAVLQESYKLAPITDAEIVSKN